MTAPKTPVPAAAPDAPAPFALAGAVTPAADAPSARELALQAALDASEQQRIQAHDDAEKLREANVQTQAALEVLRSENAELSATPAATASAAAQKVKAAYKVPEGEEGYHHVLITEQGGETLAEPIVKAFDPHQYASIAKLPGFKGDIIHKAKAK